MEETPEENEDEDEWESEERKRKEDLADRDAFVERMKARDAERTKVNIRKLFLTLENFHKKSNEAFLKVLFLRRTFEQNF